MEFSRTYNPDSCLRLFRSVDTVEKSLAESTPTIGRLIKTYGESKIEAYIKLWLVNLNEALNLKRPLTESQINETAFLVVSTFRNLTISDINLIFRKAKTGEYGSFYESISIDKVMIWFREYFEERCNVAAQISMQKADQQKYEEERNLGSTRTGMQQLRDSSILNKQGNGND